MRKYGSYLNRRERGKAISHWDPSRFYRVPGHAGIVSVSIYERFFDLGPKKNVEAALVSPFTGYPQMMLNAALREFTFSTG